ncbi:hypothetical protein PUNSTDRAFT_85384 [Punctularia strigosozonata HHB-11173 SS5]|uniref:uncharacterized protein n=1 Tax=Punctularia strigosozonata (strain HHB-11173) TaxID=741275 RepID=UPI00044179EB|nr:uncharacterized protein PUNSTDRAFT_85384 [Punctularia strigosozonata HHB-11173 SS5]EIN10933.1 hypothetical protein PUNSTDRAFT_85384 [Punctularia strigosozonata HHB-11173 SS5]
MKLTALLGCFAVVAPAYAADYFSDGWKPGQAVPTHSSSVGFVPGAEPTVRTYQPKTADKIVDRLLSSGPIAGLFSKMGVNVTERMEAARAAQANMWDHRVPLITDDNWRDLLVNEEFSSEEEEKNRVWFIIITAQMSQPEGLSKWADQHFDGAFNITQEKGDLPHVRWGRIDYLNVTDITTRWGIWQAPYLVVSTDRAQSLRFYKASNLRMDPEMIRKFLEIEGWRDTPPWASSFAPGGSREWIMDYTAIYMTKIYDVLVRIPRWAMVLITGMLGSVFIQLFHRGDKDKHKAHQQRLRQQQAAEAARAAQVAAAEKPPASPAQSTPKSKKKGGKK